MIPAQQYFLAVHHDMAIKSPKGEPTYLRCLSAVEIMRLVRRFRQVHERNRYVCWWAKAKAETLEQYVVLRERAWA
jgi:hypothetical protein